MYLASNQSGIWNDLTCPEGHEGPLFLAKFQFCNRLSIFSLCLWRLILHLLELGFASLKENLIQTRRAIASVTIHSKGSIWDQFVFYMAKYTIFLYTLSLSIIISGDIASYFLEIVMIRYLQVSWLKQEWG